MSGLETEKIDPKHPDYGKRIVAYYGDDVPIYRTELGEYLIERFGQERLAFMVNRRIVEVECQKHNIVVTDAEVDARFQEDLRSFNTHLTEQEFVNSILHKFGKTLFEWKEDVIRPKIMMEKLVEATTVITDADMKQGFEARYGPRVDCRMIVITKENKAVVAKVWENARKGESAFLEEARKQAIPDLAMAQGKVPPIHKHFGDQALESMAFRLKEGEVSVPLEMKDGSRVILFCEKHLKANEAVSFENERSRLALEMKALRISQKIPETFAKLYKEARPRFLLNNAGQLAGVVPPPQPLPSNGVVSSQVKIDIPPPPVPQEIAPLPGVKPRVEMPAVPREVILPNIAKPPLELPKLPNPAVPVSPAPTTPTPSTVTPPPATLPVLPPALVPTGKK